LDGIDDIDDGIEDDINMGIADAMTKCHGHTITFHPSSTIVQNNTR
jgi:hypothetical protein